MGRLAAFDLETTGPDPLEARIVTAAVTVSGGDQLDQPHGWLVNPGIEIPAGAIAVHGVTNEKAQAEGRLAAEAILEIVTVLAEQAAAEVPIVAFNARFDLTVLDRELRRNDLGDLEERLGGSDLIRVLDPYVIDKQIDRYRRGKRTLGAVCEHYGIILEDAHTADADAVAAAAIMRHLGEVNAELGAMTLIDLHELQIDWAAEQAASLQAYFEGQGRSERVEGAWPLIPVLEPV